MEGNEGIAPVWNLNEKGGNGWGDSCGEPFFTTAMLLRS